MIIDKMKTLDHLTIQEKYLVDYIINNQEDILKKNINELAKLSYTSSATISRLCKKLGFNGYKEFKYQYAAEYSHLLELKNDFIQELYNLYSSKKMKIIQNWNAKNNSALWPHHIVDKKKNAQIYCEICNRDKFEQEKKHRH